MKKTISVNIKGIHFIIEEEAYEMLEKYLYRLSNTLKNQKGAEEIIEDIEIRIAELLQEKMGSKRQVVENLDVKYALDTLGDPNQFVDNDEEGSTGDYESNKEQKNDWSSADSGSNYEKRLYRDTENSKIAGVCSGIANYIKIDPVIIRFFWLISFFVFGFGLLLYIILWIVIPEANSSIDRLKMKGRPITLDNVKDEVENAAKKFTESSRNFASKLKENGEITNSVKSIARILSVIFASISILIGFCFLIFLMIFFVGGFEVIPTKSDTGFLSIPQLLSLILSNDKDVDLAWVGGLLAIGSIILFLFISGFLVLFKLKNRWSKMTLSGLFIIGLIGTIICAFLVIKTARDIAIPGEIEVEIGLINANQLTIEPVSNFPTSDSKVKIKSNNIPWLTDISKGRIYNSDIEISYRESKDSNYRILSYQTAFASNSPKAIERAKHISHAIQLIDNKLLIPTEYSYPMSDKFRNQQLEIVIEIPKGKTVLISGELIYLGQNKPETEGEKSPIKKGILNNDGTFELYE